MPLFFVISDTWGLEQSFEIYRSCLIIILSSVYNPIMCLDNSVFRFEEATIDEIQVAFKQRNLTSRPLVEFYLKQIDRLNPILEGVIEVNPDALHLADIADSNRKTNPSIALLSPLHGIPILVKDNIATKDKMNTTAGSYALLDSVVPRDACVVSKLRKAGAIILGKASLSEWAHFRSNSIPSGWCARTGQGKNPYNLSADPCGSSSGSAISVAANLVTVTLGSETDGSILCPSSANSVVGIKPTVGLTSRAGVVPISPRQDTIGPICRTVADAVYVLDAIAGYDQRDEGTKEASKFIPHGGYNQFLNSNGIKGKRLGIARDQFFSFESGSTEARVFEHHFKLLRQKGAILLDHLKIDISRCTGDDENKALNAEFKVAINAYLKELIVSPVRSLADLIKFNIKFSKLEMTKEYGQELFLQAQRTNGIDRKVKAALERLNKCSRDGFEKLMRENKLDALVTPDSTASSILAIGQHPGITVPAGYNDKGVPFGICFGGLKGTEPKLIEIAYAFEQATKIRRPPPPHGPHLKPM
ncbi:probable amidase At4g34880 [Rutidosis leptorrhynchoides]|uniref:probable amidase At4g34880 n=1 Tax=Rutidosis leptorrhynchoides TaxID=125765 RepID=UPI003A98F4AB